MQDQLKSAQSEFVTDNTLLDITRDNSFIAVKKEIKFNSPSITSAYTVYFFKSDDQTLQHAEYRFLYANEDSCNEGCQKLKTYLEQQDIGTPTPDSLDLLTSDNANGFVGLWKGKDGTMLNVRLTTADGQYCIMVGAQAK